MTTNPPFLCFGTACWDIHLGNRFDFPTPGSRLLLGQDGRYAESADVRYEPGGNALNVAFALDRFGCRSRLVAYMGSQGHGSSLAKRIRKFPRVTFDAHRYCTRHMHTSFSLVVQNPGEEQEPSYVHYPGANVLLSGETLRELGASGQLDRVKFFHVAGLGLLPGCEKGFAKAVREMREEHPAMKISLDTNLVYGMPLADAQAITMPLLPLVDYFMSNEEEAMLVAGSRSLRRTLRFLRQKTTRGRPGTVVVKRGKHGCTIWPASSDAPTDVPAVHVAAVVDATGAGDVWAAAFLASLSRGRSELESARTANAAASSIVKRHGAVPDSDLDKAEALGVRRIRWEASSIPDEEAETA